MTFQAALGQFKLSNIKRRNQWQPIVSGEEMGAGEGGGLVSVKFASLCLNQASRASNDYKETVSATQNLRTCARNAGCQTVRFFQLVGCHSGRNKAPDIVHEYPRWQTELPLRELCYFIGPKKRKLNTTRWSLATIYVNSILKILIQSKRYFWGILSCSSYEVGRHTMCQKVKGTVGS